MVKAHRAYRYTWWKEKSFLQPAPTPEYREETPVAPWTQEEVRGILAHIDLLRARGMLPPLKRYVSMNAVRKDKQGNLYLASEEQLTEHLQMQEGCSIDSEGNLVRNGEIVKRGWLQSFNE